MDELADCSPGRAATPIDGITMPNELAGVMWTPDNAGHRISRTPSTRHGRIGRESWAKPPEARRRLAQPAVLPCVLPCQGRHGTPTAA